MDITRVLEGVRAGDVNATAELFPLVYAELRKVAAHRMALEAPHQTLQATELVHEAWLRLAGNDHNQAWQNRAHFFGAAAEAMRRILVERARRKKRLKRGGEWERVDFDEVKLPSPLPDEELLALDEALKQLAVVDPRAAEVVNLRFFVGLSHEEIGKMLGVSLSTIERTWTFARAWLFREMESSPERPD